MNAGVVTIGKFVHEILGGTPQRAKVIFYGLSVESHRGDGIDKAMIGGLLGLETADERILDAHLLAAEKELDIIFQFFAACPYVDYPDAILVKAERGVYSIVIGGTCTADGVSKIFLVNGTPVDIPLPVP